MSKTPFDFYNEYKNRTVDFDHSKSGVQCVDGFKCFLHWIGAPVITTGTGWADGYWFNRFENGLADNFEFIDKVKDFRTGDWVIWVGKDTPKPKKPFYTPSKSHPKSHVSMFFDGKEFGESGSIPRGFTLKRTDFSDAVGAFRWKEWAYSDIYRLYNNSDMHHYTPSKEERNALVRLGWKYEGVAWVAPRSGDPVYCVYNKRNGDHLLTTKKAECSRLVSYGLTMEGIKFYADGTIPIYRLYNRNTGEHFYTANKGEHSALIKNGWDDEGVAFYALKRGSKNVSER